MNHRRARIALALALACALGSLTGCLGAAGPRSGADEPVRDTREVLGTFVSITAYGADEDAVTMAVDAAYAEMDRIEDVTNAHDENGRVPQPAPATTSPPRRQADSVIDFNRYWRHPRVVPVEVAEVLAAVDRLGVERYFSPFLLGVIGLYEFEDGGRVPDDRDLKNAAAWSHAFVTREIATGLEVAVGKPAANTARPPIQPGIDVGGAAKGLALDRAVEALKDSGAVDAALVSAGSTTIAFGSKSDGAPWRVGIEDPRSPDALVAAIESTGTLIVSTSGDYQRYFEADTTRYHHILDPRTGRPAQGIRSLTIIGTDTGLDSDILSTALFVMGPDAALAYAEENDLGLYLIDEEGKERIAPGPADRSWDIESLAKAQ